MIVPPPTVPAVAAHRRAEPAASKGQESKPATGDAAPLRPKQLAKQKIAEREAKEREMAAKAKARAAEAKAAVAFGDDRGLLDGGRGMSHDGGAADAVSEKLRLRQLEEEADFENAQGLFDMSKSKKKADVPGVDTIDSFVARTAADGDVLAEKIANKLLSLENTPFYVEMIKSLVKKATANLQSDDVKEIATTAQVVANDKLKAEREKNKGKKKQSASKKAAVKETHNSAFDNMEDYDDAGDDYDFM
mmetsp:Transcript_8433/g.21781  ORF Transcript_8433/g.21781 Transcript_8433/m.21781 type:complete len:248 (+) Transcript_8433:304-1047(+)